MIDKKKKTVSNSTALGIIASVICAYISAVCTLPSAGITTTFPITPIAALTAAFFCKKRNYIYASMAVMPLITTLLLGFDIKRGIIVSLLAVTISFFAILAKRAAITVIKSNDLETAKKSKSVLVISVILTFFIWLAGYGNPVSFVISEHKNEKLATERYANAVETTDTYFDVSSFSYLTEISFEQAEAGKHYYICDGKRDDYLKFHINETLLDASDVFSAKTALPISCIKGYIDKNSFVFGGKAKLNENLLNTEYLIERQEAVTNMRGFENLYNNLMMYAMESEDLGYKSITMTATGLDGKTYYGYKEYNKNTIFSVNNKELEKELNEKFN